MPSRIDLKEYLAPEAPDLGLANELRKAENPNLDYVASPISTPIGRGYGSLIRIRGKNPLEFDFQEDALIFNHQIAAARYKTSTSEHMVVITREGDVYGFNTGLDRRSNDHTSFITTVSTKDALIKDAKESFAKACTLKGTGQGPALSYSFNSVGTSGFRELSTVRHVYTEASRRIEAVVGLTTENGYLAGVIREIDAQGDVKEEKIYPKNLPASLNNVEYGLLKDIIYPYALSIRCGSSEIIAEIVWETMLPADFEDFRSTLRGDKFWTVAEPTNSTPKPRVFGSLNLRAEANLAVSTAS